MKKHLPLILIAIVGFLIRVVFLDKYPPGVSWDEVSHGYNAYSILKTGVDEWGEILPLSNFRAYGDYPLALNLYITIPFIWALDLNVFSIRLPHAILGALTVIASYYLAYGLTRSKKISLMTAILMAIEPWSFFLSRFVAQSNLSVFFLTSALALFFNREKNKYFLSLSFLSLGLTLYSYHTTRIVTPVLLIILLAVYKKEIILSFRKDRVVKYLSILIFLIFFAPLPFILLNPESRARSTEVFIIDQAAVNRIEQNRVNSKYPELVNRLIYNRPLYFLMESAKNHLGYFTPHFLFFEGGTHYQFSLPERGLMYLVNLPFFYYGFYLAFKKAKKDKLYLFVILWFLVSPLSGSVTKENYAVMRATPMIPFPQVFSAIGMFALLGNLKKNNYKYIKLVGSFYLILLLINIKSYMVDYFGKYSINYSHDRQYGYNEIVGYALDNYRNYEKIIVTKKYGEPHEFFLFFSAWDPESYRNDPNLIRFYQSNWYWVDAFDKFNFVNDWEIPKEGYDFVLESGGSVRCPGNSVRCLLITSPENAPGGWNKLKTIYFLNGKPAFEIYDNFFSDIGLLKY